MTSWISKLLYSWLFIGQSKHHHVTQTSKLNHFFNNVSKHYSIYMLIKTNSQQFDNFLSILHNTKKRQWHIMQLVVIIIYFMCTYYLGVKLILTPLTDNIITKFTFTVLRLKVNRDRHRSINIGYSSLFWRFEYSEGSFVRKFVISKYRYSECAPLFRRFNSP